jgi:erythromycin esterase
MAGCLFLAALPAQAAPPLNLDFETRGDDPETPEGWFVGGAGYEVKLDEASARSGKVGLRMTRKKPGGFGVATGSLPAAVAKGKKVRLGGEIKTEDVKGGYAGLWLRVDGPDNQVLGFDNMAVRIKDGKTAEDDRGVKGTTDWKRYTIEVDVDPRVTNINFGCLLTGDGTARFDNLSVDLDGKPYDEAGKAAQAALALKPEQLAWLKENAVPFATDEAGHGFDDLKPLRAMIGDARVVALGEGTHGTAEFFRMKHRLTEFLAAEMGFTVFAIEASMPETYRVNDYVLKGEGDPKELLSGMYFWTWNTQEVLDLILWMREFNKAGKGRVEFLGFDMQEPKLAAANVRAFVAKADPDYLKTLDEAYDGLKSYHKLQRDASPRQPGGEGPGAVAAIATRLEVGKLSGRVGEVLKHLEGERDRLAAAGDPKAVDWAIQNARVVTQAVTMITAGPSHRDRCMAENVDWILAQHPPGTKVVLWAHNGHVARSKNAMGGFLARRHPTDMAVVGFAFHEGRYNAFARMWGGLKANDARPSEPGSVEHALHQTGLPRAAVDLRGASKTSPGSAWLAGPLEHRSIGALHVESAFFPAVLPEEYDVLIFFDKTSPSKLLPFVGRD